MNVGNELSFELGKYQKRVDQRLIQMQDHGYVQKLWDIEENIWHLRGEQFNVSNAYTGWLDVVEKMISAVPMIEEFYQSVVRAGFNHVVLLGMGGSSMAPLVFQNTFKNLQGIKMTVLDSTDPETIRKVENEIILSSTLFIVSSKSGNTAEVMAFYDYFFNKLFKIKEERAGQNFIAITDEGSPLAGLARRKKFRKTFLNFAGIGGRYSALSYFGIVPAALMGVDIKEFLDRTLQMVRACGPNIPVRQNPGVVLGAVLGELAEAGCDKLTYLLPESLSTFGLWIEQLLAESTGKMGKGILPVDGSPLMEADMYGKDRVFVQVEFSGKQNIEQSQKLESLISMKFPVINIVIEDAMDLGKEFFKWEIATATAGYVLEINPFDQPNVQESKTITGQLLKKIEKEGKLPDLDLSLVEDGLKYYSTIKSENGFDLLTEFFSLMEEGDYISLQAYLPQNFSIDQSLKDLQTILQKNLHVAVTTEYGPRYLHSTGQFHKGGPNKGIFVQFVCSTDMDIQIPDQKFSFESLKRAQAFGDREALSNHNRRVLLVDLGADVIKGLNTFKQMMEKIQPELERDPVRVDEFVNQTATI